MPFQQTSVTKPLAAVTRMCEAGNAVLFLPNQFGASIVINMLSGQFETEELREEEGNYMLDVWIPPAQEVQEVTQEASAGRAENSGPGFARQR